MDSNLVYLIIPVFLIIFPLFFMGITTLLSFLGGWRSLANKYKTDRNPPSNARSMQSGKMSFVRYNNVLKIGTYQDGLFLDVFLLFKAGHPALFIPWQAISEIKNTNFLFMSYYKIKVENVTILLLKKALDPLPEQLQRKITG